MKPELKPCQTFTGYFINSDGTHIFKTYRGKKERVNSFIIKKKYPARWVNIKINGKYTNFAVSKLVSDAFITPYTRGQIVKHLDGDTLNDLFTNLRVYKNSLYQFEEVTVTKKTISGDIHERQVKKDMWIALLFLFIVLLLAIAYILSNIN